MLERYDIATVASLLARRPERGDAAGNEQAAVAAILRDQDHGAEILFMRRAEHPHDPWSGHMAFPGGRREAGDVSLRITAQRETLEEVGIDLAMHGRYLGRLPDVPAFARSERTGLMVSPFVFALERDVPLVPNVEVAEAVWTPLAPLARGDTAAPFEYRYKGELMTLPSLLVGERVVWGLTYRMLQDFFQALEETA